MKRFTYKHRSRKTGTIRAAHMRVYDELRNKSPNSRWTARRAQRASARLRECLSRAFRLPHDRIPSANDADRLTREAANRRRRSSLQKILNNVSDADSRARFLGKLANLYAFHPQPKRRDSDPRADRLAIFPTAAGTRRRFIRSGKSSGTVMKTPRRSAILNRY